MEYNGMTWPTYAYNIANSMLLTRDTTLLYWLPQQALPFIDGGATFTMVDTGILSRSFIALMIRTQFMLLHTSTIAIILL